jgi:hypothetical protein
MKVSGMMAPKTSKSQVGADLCCGWGNWLICYKPIFAHFQLYQLAVIFP